MNKLSRRLSNAELFVCILVGLNVFITALHALSCFTRKRSQAEEVKYDYNGLSVPLLHPVQFELPKRPVVLTLQESTHYAWNDLTNATHDEFDGLLLYPSLSFLGPNYRQTINSWYHNFHCIAQIRAALIDHNDEFSNAHHFAHCLQYYRQFVLCASTDMVEEGDFMKKNFTVDRVGSNLVCQDWEYAFKTLEDEEKKFKEWYKSGQLQ